MRLTSQGVIMVPLLATAAAIRQAWIGEIRVLLLNPEAISARPKSSEGT